MGTVAIVGAGMAGLVCGRQLQALGHQVIWLEKSRGVGGRLATRRLTDGAWVDHGVRYWAPRCAELQQMTQQLVEQGLLYPWAAEGFRWAGELVEQPTAAYCARQGLNAIAKHLAKNHDIRRQQRVTVLTKTATGWQLTIDGMDEPSYLQADAVVLAVPAPQALPLLAPLDAAAAESLQSVRYAPCLSLMVTYGDLPTGPLNHQRGWHITAEHPVLGWLSLDSSKPARRPGVYAVLLQSQAQFAAEYLVQLDALRSDQSAVDALQQATIIQMLKAAATIVPGLDQPQSTRLHRWRYSVVQKPHSAVVLETRWPSLVGCGDWCCPANGPGLDAAYQSGVAAAEALRCS